MRHISRRDFLKTGALAAGLTIVPNSVLGKTHGFTSPSDKLNIAGVGVGGMGRGNLRNMSTENIVALCDVDWRYAEKTFNDYPKAKKFKDWRVMFDEFGKSIDAILVATPDHTHAGVTAHAITLGKHCYTQKPLTHSVYESRLLAKLTKKYKVAVKCATITPNAARMKEYDLKEMYKSPNGTIRSMLDGTVFRAPIVVKGIEPCVKNWKKPITLARHAYGDVYKNTEMVIPGPGKVELVYTSEDGTEVRELVHNFAGAGVAQGMHILNDSIESFAKSCFGYALSTKQDLWFSTKDTMQNMESPSRLTQSSGRRTQTLSLATCLVGDLVTVLQPAINGSGMRMAEWESYRMEHMRPSAHISEQTHTTSMPMYSSPMGKTLLDWIRSLKASALVWKPM